MSESQTRSKPLLQLVRLGPLVPAGPPVEATILDGSNQMETSVQFLDAKERTLLGYLVVTEEGTLAYESVADAEGGREEGERMIRKAHAEARHGAPSLECAAVHLASGIRNLYCNPRWEIVLPADNLEEDEPSRPPNNRLPYGLGWLGGWITAISRRTPSVFGSRAKTT